MLGWLEWRWLGVFIALNHQTTVGEVLLSMGAPDIVRCASHVTQPLGFWRSRPLERWLLVAPDNLVLHRTGTVPCPLRLWPLLWLLPRIVALSGALCSRPLRRLAVAPLVHRTVWWIIAEQRWRNPKLKSSELYGPGAPNSQVRQTRALFGFFCSFLFEPQLNLFIGFVEPLCTCKIYDLEQTS
jgi:hypothetical protein